MTFLSTSIFARIAFGVGIASFLFHLFSFPTPYWFQENDFNSGLFQTCLSGTCTHIAESSKSDKLKATIAMEILAFLVGISCIVLTVCFLFVEVLSIKIVRLVCIILTFVTAFLILLGVIIIAAENNASASSRYYGWSFALEIVAALMYMVSGGVFVLDMIMGLS